MDINERAYWEDWGDDDDPPTEPNWKEVVDELYDELRLAQARIAELESQLAAQAWRPVTEPPTDEGWYQTLNGEQHQHCYFTGDAWVEYYVPPTHWRPLPPPPTGGNSNDNLG